MGVVAAGAHELNPGPSAPGVWNAAGKFAEDDGAGKGVELWGYRAVLPGQLRRRSPGAGDPSRDGVAGMERAVGCSRVLIEAWISARVGGTWTGPTRAPNLPPTRRLRSQSLRGPSLSNYARR